MCFKDIQIRCGHNFRNGERQITKLFLSIVKKILLFKVRNDDPIRNIAEKRGKEKGLINILHVCQKKKKKCIEAKTCQLRVKTKFISFAKS